MSCHKNLIESKCWIFKDNRIVTRLCGFHICCHFLSLSGAYAPLTTEGNILVDGIMASCYASSHHDLGHIFLAPIRNFPQLMELIFGQSKDYPGYVKFVEDFGKIMSPDSMYTYGIN